MATKTYEERLASMKAAREEREEGAGLYHANINVLDQATLEDAVNFVKLTREQQLDVLSRTFHHSA